MRYGGGEGGDVNSKIKTEKVFCIKWLWVVGELNCVQLGGQKGQQKPEFPREHNRIWLYFSFEI